MIISREAQMREMVVGQLCIERDKVIRKMVEYWDREGEGSFEEFIRVKFPEFWIEMVRKN